MNRTALINTLMVTTVLLGACAPQGPPQLHLVEVEQQAMNDTLQYALEYNKTNQAANWVNPDTTRSGVVVPVRTFVGDHGQPCRKFITTITIDGEQQQGKGTACRQPNGFWHVLNDGPPARVTIVPSRPAYVYQPPERYYVPPYTYYNPYPINFSFSLGYLFNGGSLYIGNYYPGGPMWYPRNHWRPYKYRYYKGSRHRPYYRPHYRRHYRPHYRPHYRKHYRR